MQAIAAAPEAITNHVYMKAIINETGARSPEEALTAVRAITNAMNEVMRLTGAPDTVRAVEVVADIVMVLKECKLRQMEREGELKHAV